MKIRSHPISNQETLFFFIYKYILHNDILGFMSSLGSLGSFVGDEVSISSRFTNDLRRIYFVESIDSVGTTTIISGIVYYYAKDYCLLNGAVTYGELYYC